MFSVGRVIRIRARCLSFAEGMRCPMFGVPWSEAGIWDRTCLDVQITSAREVSLTHASFFSVEG